MNLLKFLISVILYSFSICSIHAQSQESYGGIGIRMGIDKDSSYAFLLDVFEGGPADSSGLQKQDIILEVDNQKTRFLQPKIIADLIHGAPGTKVNLLIRRNNEEMIFIVTRKKLLIPTLKK